MNTNDLNTALYEKMAAEQEQYRDWLKGQPPEEILHHAYEYSVREDIVMAMEELELTDAQEQALLDSPSPLADVYHYFEKLETAHMDVVRDSIEKRADDVTMQKVPQQSVLMEQAKGLESVQFAGEVEISRDANDSEPEKQWGCPVYRHSAAYAAEHGEADQYRASYQASMACKEAIEQAISTHYGDNRLDTEAAVRDVLEKFSLERVQYILANTVLKKDFDGRISHDSKAWAKTIPMPEDEDTFRHSAYLVVDKVNPGLTDLFLKQARKVMQEPEKSSVLQKLKQEPPAHKPAPKKKREQER